MSLNLDSLQARALRAYELARLRRALLGVIPLAVMVAFACLLTTGQGLTVALGVVLLVGGAGSIWWGHGLDQALVHGVLAGVFPLVTVVCLTRVGHTLMGSACIPLCVGASAVGGVVAGLLVGRWALRQRTPAALVLVASGYGLLTGALGSAHLGMSGLVALGAGFMVAFGVQSLRGYSKGLR